VGFGHEDKSGPLWTPEPPMLLHSADGFKRFSRNVRGLRVF